MRKNWPRARDAQRLAAQWDSASDDPVVAQAASSALPSPSTHILTTRHLLLHSDAIAVLPGLIAEGEPGLAPLPVDLPFVSSAVGITEAADRAPSPATWALADCLRAVAA